MNIDEIVFDSYVICPICKKIMKGISGSHLQVAHGYESMREFKIEYGIPMQKSLICHDSVAKMRENGQRRAKWFKKNVMPIGVEMSKKMDMVPKELRKHSGNVRRGLTWIPDHLEKMQAEGWIDLHEASKLLNISYNYTRKCATDKRLKTVNIKGIRFTKKKWIEQTAELLRKNRIKYNKPERPIGPAHD